MGSRACARHMFSIIAERHGPALPFARFVSNLKAPCCSAFFGSWLWPASRPGLPRGATRNAQPAHRLCGAAPTPRTALALTPGYRALSYSHAWISHGATEGAMLLSVIVIASTTIASFAAVALLTR